MTLRLLDGGAAIAIELGGRSLRYHAVWLRDNALDADTRDPANGQRRVTLLDLPADTRIQSAEWQGDRLVLTFAQEGKRVAFDRSWLAAHAYDRDPTQPAGWTGHAVTRWDAASAEQLPVWDHEEVSGVPAARVWLESVRRHGFARLRNAPIEPGVTIATLGLFGHVRETHYGRTFDVRIEAAPINLAYTAVGLQPHTDNPYRDPPPGLQLLACLRNAARGGETILVDGFMLCQRLQAEDPHAFALLAAYPARFAYAGSAGVRLYAKRPIVELGADGELIAIRFNNRSAAPLVDVPYEDMTAYYAACRRFAELLEDPALRLRFRMAPGDLIVIDNLRVLHGRDGFTGEGDRWLEGCYADRDGLLSTLAALEEAI